MDSIRSIDAPVQVYIHHAAVAHMALNLGLVETTFSVEILATIGTPPQVKAQGAICCIRAAGVIMQREISSRAILNT